VGVAAVVEEAVVAAAAALVGDTVKTIFWFK
jgi:hypothetical protein